MTTQQIERLANVWQRTWQPLPTRQELGGLILLRKQYPEAVEIVLPAGTWKRGEVQ